MSRSYPLSATFAERRPSAINVDVPLPLEEAVRLHFAGQEYHIPHPLDGLSLFFRSHELICGFYHRAGKLIVATLQERMTRPTQQTLQQHSLLGEFNLTEMGPETYQRIGQFLLAEHVGKTEHGRSCASLQMSGFIKGENGKIKNVSALFREKDHFTMLVLEQIGEIGSIRYNLNYSCIVTYPERTLRGAGSLFNCNMPYPPSKPSQEVYGYLPHSEVRKIALHQMPLRSRRKLIFSDEKAFTLDPYITPPLNRETPIVGVYTHPFDKDKIVLARLLERASGRNHLLITEYGETERDIGYLYFRVLPERILADGFAIGEGLMTFVGEQEGQELRGKGLGTRVLETAEELFRRRYKASNIEFETVQTFYKEGIAQDTGRFFRRNRYKELAGSIQTEDCRYASFVKEI